MEFGEVTQVSGASFYASQMQGILGLAYGSISVDKLPTFIDTMNLSDHSFTFYLNLDPTTSYLTIPGFDEDLHSNEDFTFHNVVEEKYWALNLSTITAGTTSIDASKYKAVIDSGTSVLVGPNSLVKQITANMPRCHIDCSNIKDFPDVSFTIDGTPYTLTGQDYIVQVTQSGITECMMGIMGSDFPIGFNYFILGDVFMRQYTSYFDKNNNRVGFAMAA